uniref:Uncharacterized protein n=1 Tax=Romanomermis culicivorax TaxID=13658 RepID=A0A915KLD0_ROMCU
MGEITIRLYKLDTDENRLPDFNVRQSQLTSTNLGILFAPTPNPLLPLLSGTRTLGVPPPAALFCGPRRQDQLYITIHHGEWKEQKHVRVFPPQNVFIKFKNDEPFSIQAVNTKIVNQIHKMDKKLDTDPKIAYQICTNDEAP